jgi:uroporphyrinogen-III synthase
MEKSVILIVREYDLFSRLLAENGFEIINFPLIQTASLEDLSELHEKLGMAEKYDGFFFTSPKAAEVFLRQSKSESDFSIKKFYVLGNRTKLLFENAGFETVFKTEANTAEEFINSFDAKSEFAGKKFLFLRGDKSLRAIPELLKNVAQVDEVIVYQTIENQTNENFINEIRNKLTRAEMDWICFFSPSGVESFVKKFIDVSLAAVKVAAIGETTARKAAEENLKIEFVSPKANSEAFAFGLINHIKNIER